MPRSKRLRNIGVVAMSTKNIVAETGDWLPRSEFDEILETIRKEDGTIDYIKAKHTLVSFGDLQSLSAEDPIDGSGGSVVGLLTSWAEYDSATANDLALSAELGHGLLGRIQDLEGAGYLTAADISHLATNSALTAHINDTAVHITAEERTKWNKTATDLSAILGTDSDTIINKWEEVIAFLDTYTEADTLAKLLSNKVSKAGDTMTGALGIKTDTQPCLKLDSNTANKEVFMYICSGGASKNAVGWNATYGAYIYNYPSAKYLGIKDDGTPHFQGNTLWHSGNMGPGSNLNADLLDGLHASDLFATKTLFSKADYQYYVVLLWKTNEIATHRISGKLYTETAGSQRYQAADIDMWFSRWNSTSYDSNLRLVTYGLGTAWKLVTCTYNGEEWYALQHTNIQATAACFVGVSARINFTAVKYYTSNTSTVDNAEIYSSIVDRSNLLKRSYVGGNAIAYITDTVAAADKLSNNATFSAWGQTFFENGVPKSVSGAMTNVTDITMSGTLKIGSITLKDVNGHLEIDKTIVSLGDVQSLSASDVIEGGGTIADMLKEWSDYNNSMADTHALSAKLGVELHNRLMGVENSYISRTVADSLYQTKGNYVTTDTPQTISGHKTFSGNIIVSNMLYFKNTARENGIYIAERSDTDAIVFSHHKNYSWVKNIGTLDINGALTMNSFVKSGGTSSQFLKADGSVDSNSYALVSDVNNKINIKVIDCMHTTEWSDIRVTGSTALTMRAFDVYGTDAGGPTTYGNVLEIAGRSGHWQPQLWFDGGKTGSLCHRNKNYNDNSWGEWYKLIDTNNYASVLDDHYVTRTTAQSITAKKTFTDIGLGSISADWNVAVRSNSFHWLHSSTTASPNAPGTYWSGVSFMTGYVGFQLAVYGGVSEFFKFRKAADNGTWTAWRDILHSGNYNSYALPLTGGMLTGALTIQTGLDQKIYFNNTDADKVTALTFQQDGVTYSQIRAWETKFDFSKYVQAPYFVADSTTLCTNLNADLLDGYHADINDTASTLVVRDADANVRLSAIRNSRGKGIALSSAGWYRVFTSGIYDAGGDNVILNIARAFAYEDNEAYQFAISIRTYRSGYKPCITQLSGTFAARLITKIRVVQKYNSVYYIDIYYSGSNANEVFISGFGTGTFCAPVAATIPDGYTATEFDTAQGVKSNNQIETAADLIAYGDVRTTRRFISTVATGTSPLAVNSTTCVTNLNADMLDGQHLSWLYNETTIDASSLDQNTWYPVTMQLAPVGHEISIEVSVALNSNTKPSWATHDRGFSVYKKWTTNGSAWGTQYVRRHIQKSSYNWATSDPVRGIGQMTNASFEYFYVRGGGKYFVRTNRGVTPVLRTSAFTDHDQTVAPTTTPPAEVVEGLGITSELVAADATHKLCWDPDLNAWTLEGTLVVKGDIQSLSNGPDYEEVVRIKLTGYNETVSIPTTAKEAIITVDGDDWEKTIQLTGDLADLDVIKLTIYDYGVMGDTWKYGNTSITVTSGKINILALIKGRSSSEVRFMKLI